MSSVIGTAWRVPCLGTRAPSMPSVIPKYRDLRFQAFKASSLHTTLSYSRSFNSLVSSSQIEHRSTPLPSSLKFPLPTFQLRFKRTSAAARRSPRNTSETLPGGKTLTDAELKEIFPQSPISRSLANRTLAVLHARRLEGTLDLDLPLEITRTVSQRELDNALEWLRANYAVDEDAAIMDRIQREEIEAEGKLLRRAEKLGLYKPQSGSYEAELGENDSVYGKSVLKEAREQNEKRLLEERELERQKWLQGEHEERERLQRQVEGNTSLQQYQESSMVEARPRADPNERPYLAWVQKHHVAGTHNQPDAVNITTTRRLLPSLLFLVATLGLCYHLSVRYHPRAKKDRLWPDIPPAAATVGAIIGANVVVTLMWKYVPPSWRLLNRYFILVPFYPSALSNLGSTFSHQTWRHLATNMFVLGFMGPRVHDELGRGNFLAIYFGSGVVGSVVSLFGNVLRGTLAVTSLGASAATGGIVAAWCMFHFDDQISLWILPKGLQDIICTKGWIIIALIAGTDLLGMIAPRRFLRVFPLSRLMKMDHMAHLGGYAMGAHCGYALAAK